MAAMISRGADGIITDDPALARRVVGMRRSQTLPLRLLSSLGAEVATFGKLR